MKKVVESHATHSEQWLGKKEQACEKGGVKDPYDLGEGGMFQQKTDGERITNVYLGRKMPCVLNTLSSVNKVCLQKLGKCTTAKSHRGIQGKLLKRRKIPGQTRSGKPE